MPFNISDSKLASIEIPAPSPKLEELPKTGQTGIPEQTGILTIILLLSPIAIVLLWQVLNRLFFKKLRMIKAGTVKVVVDERPSLGSIYGIPIKVYEPYAFGMWAVKVVRPELTESGSVQYRQGLMALKDLVIPESTDAQVVALERIASVVKERSSLINQLDALERHCLEAEQVQKLVRSSGLYASQADQLEKVQHQQRQAVAKIQALIELQDQYIQKSLIASRVKVFNFDKISDCLPSLDAQFQQLQQQYQETRDFVNAYWELKHSSQVKGY